MSTVGTDSFVAAGGGPPKSLFGYEVIDFIGVGAGSQIYAVTHPSTHQIYALKHVVPQNDKGQRFIEQLEAEFEVGRQVNHPGLRKSIDYKANRTLLRKVTEAVLVMELFDGQSLDRELPKTVAGIVQVFIQTAEALGALHALGYVHCDLKPNNILLDAKGMVKVIDLGQACRAGTVKPRIQGTPDYIAPEQVKLEPVSLRTDVYNFGATMYWALAGKNLPTLFTLKKGDNSFLVDSAMPSPRDENPQVPEKLSDLVMECVRTNPAKRPADMAELSRRLEIVLHVMRKSRADTGSGLMRMASV